MLVLPLMRADAGGTLAVAVLALLVLLIPFRRGELWAFVAVPLGAFVLAACALYAMRTLATNAPASPPLPTDRRRYRSGHPGPGPLPGARGRVT